MSTTSTTQAPEATTDSATDFIGPLPADMWSHICKEFLPATSVLNLAISARSFRYILQSNYIWKSLVEAEFGIQWNEGQEDPELDKNLDRPGQYLKSYRQLVETRSLIILPQDSKLEQFEFLCKIVLIGDYGVGKSCMALRFARDEYTDSYISTIGVDFVIRNVKTKEGNKAGPNLSGKLQIWDTGSGRTRFANVTSAYYRGSSAIMLLFDITDRDSYEHTLQWYENIERYAKRDEIVVVLVGNKCDLKDKRQVTTEEARQRAHERFGGAFYLETSSKDNINVKELFAFATNKLLELHPDKIMRTAAPPKTTPVPKNPAKKPCTLM